MNDNDGGCMIFVVIFLLLLAGSAFIELLDWIDNHIIPINYSWISLATILLPLIMLSIFFTTKAILDTKAIKKEHRKEM